MNRTKYFFLLFFAPALGACVSTMTAPDSAELEYASWSTYLAESGLVSEQGAESGIGQQVEHLWWTGYQDQQLNQLVESALQDNLDLKIARSKIRQARAAERVELSVTRPQIGVSASLTEQQLSETGSIPAGRIPGFEIKQTVYQAGFDAAWELDLFGRNPKRRAIAESRYRNQLELQYDLHLSIVAEVARSYLQLRVLQAQRRTMQNTVDQQQRIAEAVQTTHKHGAATAEDVDRAGALIAEYQALLPAVDAQIRSSIYQLSVLSGQPPEALNQSLTSTSNLPADVTNGLASISSDLLRRRADVRYAERQYVIASQQQKLAKLAIYPTFSLFGGAGPNTIDFDLFSDDESLAFNFGGLIHWPLYNGGRLRAQATIAEEIELQAQYNYSNTILKALQDVESTGARLIESKKEFTARQSAHAAHRRIADNTQQKYQAGVSNLVTWLNAEQQVMQSQLALLDSQSQVLQYSVALHKAIGGGWLLAGKDE